MFGISDKSKWYFNAMFSISDKQKWCAHVMYGNHIDMNGVQM